MAEMPDRSKVNQEINRIIARYQDDDGSISALNVTAFRTTLIGLVDATAEEALNYGSEIGQAAGARDAAPPEDSPGPLHAHELSADDAACINMLAGSQWAPDASLTLPSGRTVTGAEISRWVQAP